MWSKVFSPLLANRLTPAQKFPQLKLRPHQHILITHKRECIAPLSLFDANSTDFARREIVPGSVVELRDAERHRLVALGFYEPALDRVDVFHLTPKVVVELPIIDETFFMVRFQRAWQQRRRVFAHVVSGGNNAYRVVNGAVDGLPSLYVDLYSTSFARIVATSFGAERLVPSVAELLRRRGAEQLLLDTPYLKDREKLTLIHPTVPLQAVYVENGTRHLWLPPAEYPTTPNNRWLLNTAHRRLRVLLRDLSKGKRVLCLNDRSGAAALNAVMSAKSVLLVEADVALLDRIRENLVANHGTAIFNICETTSYKRVEELDVCKQDIIYLEHHPDTLWTAEQWKTTLSILLKQRICGDGTLLFVAQEVAPLGIPDFCNSQHLTAHVKPALREELCKALSAAAATHNISLRQLFTFGPSIDHPILPSAESLCFSLVFLLEKKI